MGPREAVHKAGGWGAQSGVSLMALVSFASAVPHHVCEQASEQAELGGDGTGDPGELCSAWGDHEHIT